MSIITETVEDALLEVLRDVPLTNPPDDVIQDLTTAPELLFGTAPTSQASHDAQLSLIRTKIHETVPPQVDLPEKETSGVVADLVAVFERELDDRLAAARQHAETEQTPVREIDYITVLEMYPPEKRCRVLLSLCQDLHADADLVDEIAPLLAENLHHSTSMVRKAASHALASASEANPAVLADHLDALVAGLAVGPATVRSNITHTIWRLAEADARELLETEPEIATHIGRCLRDADDATRAVAIRTLKTIAEHDPEAVRPALPPLNESRRDCYPAVARGADRLLQHMLNDEENPDTMPELAPLESWSALSHDSSGPDSEMTGARQQAACASQSGSVSALPANQAVANPVSDSATETADLTHLTNKTVSEVNGVDCTNGTFEYHWTDSEDPIEPAYGVTGTTDRQRFNENIWINK